MKLNQRSPLILPKCHVWSRPDPNRYHGRGSGDPSALVGVIQTAYMITVTQSVTNKGTARAGNEMELDILRNLVHDMVTGNLPGCEQALSGIGAALNLPLIGFVPDISSPYFNEETDAFFRRGGWPEPLLTIWWQRRAPIRTGLFIRCRLAALPFATGITPEDEHRRGANADEREMTRQFLRYEISTVLSVPVHLPGGRIALLVFGGTAPVNKVKAELEAALPDLIAAGHLVMRAWRTAHPQGPTENEQFSSLTAREWECLRLLAQGARDAEIARLDGISVTTVRYHVENVVRKLGATNRIHAVALGSQLGLIGPLAVP